MRHAVPVTLILYMCVVDTKDSNLIKAAMSSPPAARIPLPQTPMPITRFVARRKSNCPPFRYREPPSTPTPARRPHP